MPRAAIATIPKRGTAEIASEVALTTLRALMARARVSPEEGFFTVRIGTAILGNMLVNHG